MRRASQAAGRAGVAWLAGDASFAASADSVSGARSGSPRSAVPTAKSAWPWRPPRSSRPGSEATPPTMLPAAAIAERLMWLTPSC